MGGMRAKMLPFVLLLVTAACDDSVGPEPVSRARALELCRDACDHQRSCGLETSDSCVSDCASVAGILRGDVLVALAECRSRASCRQEDDSCDSVIESFDPLPIHEAFHAGCVRRNAECFQGSFSCDHDDLRAFVAFNEGFMRPAVACWDEPCEEILDCLVRTLGDYVD